MRPLLITATLASLLTIPPSYAQTSGMGLTTNSKDPVEITTDTSLEWHRNDNKFLATGNAKATQGLSAIAADRLKADYRDGQTSSMEIYHLSATGNVTLTSGENTGYGDQADYDLDKGLAVMTGKNLKMLSPDQTVTARDRFEYETQNGKVHAIGDAKVIRPKVDGSGTDTLQADKITATLKENEQGQQKLDTLEAFDNVVIVTPTETITGAYGIYRANTNKAEITGGVTIKRGPNILQGARAEVDLNTNISRMFGANGSQNGRVRGVFYPGSNKQ